MISEENKNENKNFFKWKDCPFDIKKFDKICEIYQNLCSKYFFSFNDMVK